MKKIISLFVAISIGLSLAGCQKNRSHIESAEKHGYWYGFDGITWGMTIDECKAAIGLNEDGYILDDAEDAGVEEYINVKLLSYNGNHFGADVKIQLCFNDVAPFEMNTEWLYAVLVQPLEDGKFKYEDTLNKIDSELDSLKQTYKVVQSRRESLSSINTITDKKIKERTIVLANEMFDSSPIKDELLKNSLNEPLDSITIFAPSPAVADTNVKMLRYDGTNAALVALAEHGRSL